MIPPDSDILDTKKCFIQFLFIVCEVSKYVLDIYTSVATSYLPGVFIMPDTVDIHRKYSPYLRNRQSGV